MPTTSELSPTWPPGRSHHRRHQGRPMPNRETRQLSSKRRPCSRSCRSWKPRVRVVRRPVRGAALQPASKLCCRMLVLRLHLCPRTVEDEAESMWAEAWADVERARTEFRLLFAKLPKKASGTHSGSCKHSVAPGPRT